MAIRKVSRMGHPVLREKARPLTEAEIRTPDIQRLIDDMFETMGEYQGIGLAAPQVYEGLRIFVAGNDADLPLADLSDDGPMPRVALINPELTQVGRVVETDWEGCLSIPDIRGQVPRAKDILVRALDREGRRVEFRASGFPARVIQHETDHLDGVLFFDRMRSFETLSYLDEYQRYWLTEDEDEDEE
ncbi:MAG: peptide deformylase [Acidobacteriota bacterium]|nr:peptide deformylase [Acidobacteriota bacterium]